MKQIQSLLTKPIILVILLTLLGGFFRFYNLEWGTPFHFHPDERNIAIATTKLQIPQQLDPDFYAYGSLPIYIIANIVESLSVIVPDHDPFALAVYTSRFFSALLSTLLIPLIYYLGRRYLHPSVGLIAACLTAFTPGFIQYAHFGTFEIWLTITRLLLLWALIKYYQLQNGLNLFLIGLFFGISVSIKVTSLFFALPIILVIFSPTKLFSISRIQSIANSFFSGFLILLIALTIFIISNPYAFNFSAHFLNTRNSIDSAGVQALLFSNPQVSRWQDIFYPPYLHSINVESGIARGDISVFYTRQFNLANPISFSLAKIYPWIYTPLFPLITIPALILFIIKNVLHRRRAEILILIFLLIHLAFTSTLFVKWSRYLIPALPYYILITSWFLMWIYQTLNSHLLKTLTISSILVFQFIWSLSIFQIYTQPDPRLQAAEWANQHLPPDTRVMSEIFDLGIIPFNSKFPVQNIKLFHFYDLDTQPEPTPEQLYNELEQTDVIVILSRRIWANAIAQPHQYPHAAQFYQRLFTSQTDFELVAEFYNSPRIFGQTISDELLAEETFTVFDHPHIQVWARSGYLN